MSSTADLVMDSNITDLPPKMKDEESTNNTVKTFRTMTMGERMGYMRKVVTVEPILAAYLLASLICSQALVNLLLEKTCRVNLKMNDTVCDLIPTGKVGNFTEENNQVQVVIANMLSWQVPLQSVVPLIMILFLGSFSDRHKLRKPFMLVPMIGELFAVAGCILCVFYLHEWPVEVQGILQTVIPSLFGGQPMITMAIFSYIADVSTLEMRTLRIAIVQISLNICIPVGVALSGILFELIGYYGVLTIAVFLYLFAILYGFFCIQEPKKPDIVWNRSLIFDAFDPKHALDTVNLLLKKNPGCKRLFIVALFVLMFSFSCISTGEEVLFEFYLQKVYSFGPLERSYYDTTYKVAHLIGISVGIAIFTKCLNLSDLTILIITYVDRIASKLLLANASSTTMLYCSIFVGLMFDIMPISIRAMETKFVSENDIGKAQSLFGVGEVLGGIVAGSVYNQLYSHTIESFPSAFLYFGVIICLICILIATWMYFKTKTRENRVEADTEQVNGKFEQYQTTHM